MLSDVHKLRVLQGERRWLYELVVDLALGAETLTEVVQGYEPHARPQEGSLCQDLPPRLDPARLSAAPERMVNPSLPVASVKPGGGVPTDPGSRLDAFALRLSSRPCVVPAGRLADQRHAGSPAVQPRRPTNSAEAAAPTGDAKLRSDASDPNQVKYRDEGARDGASLPQIYIQLDHSIDAGHSAQPRLRFPAPCQPPERPGGHSLRAPARH